MSIFNLYSLGVTWTASRLTTQMTDQRQQSSHVTQTPVCFKGQKVKRSKANLLLMS